MILTSAGLTGLDVFAADYNIWLVQCEKGAQSLRETGTKYEEKDGIIKVPTKDQFLAGLISNDTCSVRLKGDYDAYSVKAKLDFGKVREDWTIEADTRGNLKMSAEDKALLDSTVESKGSVDVPVLIEENGETSTSATIRFVYELSNTPGGDGGDGGSDEPTGEGLKVYKSDGTEIAADSTIPVNGSEYMGFKVSAEDEASGEYNELGPKDFEISADNKDIEITRTVETGFSFDAPGSGTITITYGDKKFAFKAESSFVPVSKITQKLPETVEMQNLIYGLGDGDNYTGILGKDLYDDVTVEPENASYKYNVAWSSDNTAIAEYSSKFDNGFIGHSEGDVIITASIDQGTNADPVKAQQKVTFKYKNPVEALSTGTPELTIKVGETAVLNLTFTPEVPSQAKIDREQLGSGSVEVKRGKNNAYSKNSNTQYSVVGKKAGSVVLTGKAAAAKEGTSPEVTYRITVAESDGTVKETPDENKITAEQKKSILQFYKAHPISLEYGDEWNIIALCRARIDPESVAKDGRTLKDYEESLKEQTKGETGKLRDGGKPTDIARVIMAMRAANMDPADLGGKDLVASLLNNERVSTLSNESIFTLIAIDIAPYEVPEGSLWDRDKLIAEILKYQCGDGSFSLIAGGTGGSVDMTAMALQAIAGYTDRDDVRSAVDKGLDYLRDKIDNGTYGSPESDAQAAVALLTLGMDPALPENGFANDAKTLFEGLDEYRLSTGGFEHIKGRGADMMASQQALLAVGSWERFASGRNPLYEMSDVEKNENESENGGGKTVADNTGNSGSGKTENGNSSASGSENAVKTGDIDGEAARVYSFMLAAASLALLSARKRSRG